VDEVSVVGPEVVNSLDSGAWEWKERWEDIIAYPEKMNLPYISGGTVKDAYHRTLTKNRKCIVEPQTGAFKDFTPFESGEQGASKSTTSEILSAAFLSTFDTWKFEEGFEEESKHDYLFEMDIQGQRLFTTRKGYLGIGSSKTRIGDLACVLLGGNVPFLLRPTDELNCQLQLDSLACSFVGQAYVNGIMNGEAIRGRTNKIIFSIY